MPEITNSNFSGAFSDDWSAHKDDILWRRFWALWEIKRKWQWAQWFYVKLDKVENKVVAPECWSLFGGEGFMYLCYWIASLYSLYEGLIDNLDSYNTPKAEKIDPKTVFENLPEDIINNKVFTGRPFKDFRNAIFHCQWTPTLPKLKLDQSTTNELDKLHQIIGIWVKTEFKKCYLDFEKKYSTQPNWIYTEDGEEFMPECF